MVLPNPTRCPDCDNFAAESAGAGKGEVKVCLECGLVWSIGESDEEQYSQQEMDLEYLTEEENMELRSLEDMDSRSADFTPCPLCSSDRIVQLVKIDGNLAGRCLCRECGCEFKVLDNQEEEEWEDEGENVHGVIETCPHCNAPNSIQAYGGAVWCERCWLDPDQMDQDSPDIAKLYKNGIKRALEKDVGLLKADRPYGEFIREKCGPHCDYANPCPQTAGNLINCFREYLSEEEEDIEIVGKRKRGRKGKNKQKTQNLIRNHNRNRKKNYKIKASKVAFSCSKGGLLEKMVLYGTTDPDTEQPGGTGSQSGA